jgi:hypothetical protein
MTAIADHPSGSILAPHRIVWMGGLVLLAGPAAALGGFLARPVALWLGARRLKPLGRRLDPRLGALFVVVEHALAHFSRLTQCSNRGRGKVSSAREAILARAGERESPMLLARGQRRRRSNRPGNSQATGPLGCVTLWKAPSALRRRPPKGRRAANSRLRRSSQVTRQRGQ